MIQQLKKRIHTTAAVTVTAAIALATAVPALGALTFGALTTSSDGAYTIDAVGVLELNSSAGVIGLGNDAVAQNINVGTGAAARTITIGNETGATAVTIDSGTGAINIGDAIAKTITIGNATGATALVLNSGTGDIAITSIDDVSILGGSAGSVINVGTNTDGNAINIGTNNTTADTIAIGSALDTSSVSGIAVTVGSTGTTSALTLQSGTGDVTVTSTDDFTLTATDDIAINSGSTSGIINIGTSAFAHVINVGTNAIGNTINIGTDNTVADTITIGSALDTLTITGTSAGANKIELAATRATGATGSYQTLAGDLTYQGAAGGTSTYHAGVMGNFMGDTLTNANATIHAGVVGKYSVTTSDALVGPKAGLVGEAETSVANAAVIAVLGGDGGAITPGAAYAVRSMNSTGGAGFTYGLDLFSAAIGSYGAVSYGTADIRLQNGETISNATDGVVNFGVTNLRASTYNFGSATAVAGTGDAITIDFTPDLPALAAGLKVTFVAEAANTGATTLAIDGGTAKAVNESADNSALEANDIRSGAVVELVYDGTQWQQISQSGN